MFAGKVYSETCLWEDVSRENVFREKIRLPFVHQYRQPHTRSELLCWSEILNRLLDPAGWEVLCQHLPDIHQRPHQIHFFSFRLSSTVATVRLADFEVAQYCLAEDQVLRLLTSWYLLLCQWYVSNAMENLSLQLLHKNLRRCIEVIP